MFAQLREWKTFFPKQISNVQCVAMRRTLQTPFNFPLTPFSLKFRSFTIIQPRCLILFFEASFLFSLFYSLLCICSLQPSLCSVSLVVFPKHICSFLALFSLAFLNSPYFSSEIARVTGHLQKKLNKIVFFYTYLSGKWQRQGLRQ